MDFFCTACVENFKNKEEFHLHLASSDHRLKWLNKKYHSAESRLEILGSKEGLLIDVIREKSDNCNENNKTIPYVVEIITDTTTTIILRLIHKGSDSFHLSSINVLTENRLNESCTSITIADSHGVANGNQFLMLKNGDNYDVQCIITPGSIVRPLRIPIVFQFQHLAKNEDSPPESFYIGKLLVIKSASYNVRHFGNFVRGIFPSFKEDEEMLKLEKGLGMYYVPKWFEKNAKINNLHEVKKKMGLDDEVNENNHLSFFKTLLWLEELQDELDIQYYSKKNVTMKFDPDCYYNGVRCVELKEKGLAENRPSLLVTDEVFVCPSRQAGSFEQPTWYQGYIYYIAGTSVFLGFDQHSFFKKFNEYTLFDVEYGVNRFPYRVCHRALEMCHKKSKDIEPITSYLFPSSDEAQEQEQIYDSPGFVPYNSLLNDNPEQLKAVSNIVNSPTMTCPYVIFGPPGTGKTVTVVEAIMQVLRSLPESHVLVCAPSNSAANVIADRLVDAFGAVPGQQNTPPPILRMFAMSQMKFMTKLSPKLMSVSNYFPDRHQLVFPSKDRLLTFKVIITTYLSAGKIAAAGFPKGHFSHFFLDEAGQAMECEAMVPLGGILALGARVVIAGDHYQLGPIVRNVQATAGVGIFPKTGLDTSFLERLMNMPLYQKEQGVYNSRFVTKLVKNYRSCKDILQVPNDLFYNSELQAVGQQSVVNCFLDWKFLPSLGFPVIFHSVAGKDRMEKYSPSFYNKEELVEVLRYLRLLLLDEMAPRAKAEEIGIISPYRLQVEKLRNALRESKEFEKSWHLFKIGSVEDFQGDERKVIIISTVRASQNRLPSDDLFKLGFLRNPKRLNVSITRAQSLLIVVGCAEVLMLDSNWKDLIMFIKKKGGFCGRPLKDDDQDYEQVIQKVEKMDIRPRVGEVKKTSVVEAPTKKNVEVSRRKSRSKKK